MLKIISLLIFIPVFALGQNIVKIDNAKTLENTSFRSNTIYQLKSGITYDLIDNIELLEVSDVIIGSYGEGDPPFLKLSSDVEKDVIYIRECNNIVIENLKVFGNADNNVVHVSGHFDKTAEYTTNVTIRHCELAYGFNGVRSLPYQTKCDIINVLNCNIHHTNDDGIFIMDCDDITIDSCHIWHVNLAWTRGGSNSGDCIHLINHCNNWSVTNNILDRRLTSNKFCFIYGTKDYKPMSGKLIGNTFYPPKDTTGGTGSCIYISFADHVKIESNKFLSEGYQWGGKPGSIAQVMSASAEFNNNYIEGLSYCRFTSQVENVIIKGNTVVDANAIIFYYANDCVATDNTFYNLKGWAYSAGDYQSAKLEESNTKYLDGYPEE